MEFSSFVKERLAYPQRNIGISDYMVRSNRRKLRPFGKDIDHKLLFVYKKLLSETRIRYAGSWRF